MPLLKIDDKKHKEIRISKKLLEPRQRAKENQARELKLLEIFIHESFHALSWHTSEQYVSDGAEELAAVLWKLGYRRKQ